MTVRVYVETVLLEEVTFSLEQEALEFASEQQDAGYKVRVFISK
jgi:hypothetical protein